MIQTSLAVWTARCNYAEPNIVALIEDPCVEMFDQVRTKMINQHVELKNQAESSKKEAECAIQQCEELKNENESLRGQIEEEKFKNEELKKFDAKSKQEIEDLKTQNEEMKKKMEASLMKVKLYGQYGPYCLGLR